MKEHYPHLERIEVFGLQAVGEKCSSRRNRRGTQRMVDHGAKRGIKKKKKIVKRLRKWRENYVLFLRKFYAYFIAKKAVFNSIQRCGIGIGRNRLFGRNRNVRVNSTIHYTQSSLVMRFRFGETFNALDKAEEDKRKRRSWQAIKEIVQQTANSSQSGDSGVALVHYQKRSKAGMSCHNGTLQPLMKEYSGLSLRRTPAKTDISLKTDKCPERNFLSIQSCIQWTLA